MIKSITFGQDSLAQPCRSALYVPASNSRALAKAPTLAADAIIIDLEDAVAPAGRPAARVAAVEALRGFADAGARLRVLRINALGSDDSAADLAMLDSVLPDAVLLPKVNSVAEISELSMLLDKCDPARQVELWAMMETPAALVNAAAIAASRQHHSRLTTWVIGTNDLALETGVSVGFDRRYLTPWLMQLVLTASAARLRVLDGTYNDFSDNAGLESECLQGYRMGMHGKTLIHPAQIKTTNQCFTPGAEELAQARAVVQAFDDPGNADAAVLQVDGRMVERLHLVIAQRALALAKHSE